MLPDGIGEERALVCLACGFRRYLQQKYTSIWERRERPDSLWLRRPRRKTPVAAHRERPVDAQGHLVNGRRREDE
jgi:hypothetical protein